MNKQKSRSRTKKVSKDYASRSGYSSQSAPHSVSIFTSKPSRRRTENTTLLRNVSRIPRRHFTAHSGARTATTKRTNSVIPRNIFPMSSVHCLTLLGKPRYVSIIRYRNIRHGAFRTDRSRPAYRRSKHYPKKPVVHCQVAHHKFIPKSNLGARFDFS